MIPYAIAPEFKCLNCGKADRFAYQERHYMVVCSRCSIHYPVKDISRGKPLWLCKDGRVMPIADMKDSHLHNCIAKIFRQPDWRPGYLKLLIDELERRYKREDAA